MNSRYVIPLLALAFLSCQEAAKSEKAGKKPKSVSFEEIVEFFEIPSRLTLDEVRRGSGSAARSELPLSPARDFSRESLPSPRRPIDPKALLSKKSIASRKTGRVGFFSLFRRDSSIKNCLLAMLFVLFITITICCSLYHKRKNLQRKRSKKK